VCGWHGDGDAYGVVDGGDDGCEEAVLNGFVLPVDGHLGGAGGGCLRELRDW
jgi:hypothetical protein